MTARYLVAAMAAAVTGVAMYASATSLHEIAVADHLAAAWAMPFCLDLLAITTTTAAVLGGQRGPLVHVGPPTAYAISLSLQVSAAWQYGLRACAVHAIPLVAAGYLSEVLLRMWTPAEAVLPAAQVEEPPDAARSITGANRRGQVRKAVPLDELVRQAEEAAARRGVAPTDLTQANLKADLHIGSNRAVDVYHALRRPNLEVVPVSRS